MDVGRVGSLFIRGLESFTGCNEMVFTLTFEEPYDAARLLHSFDALIRSRPALRLRLIETGRGSFEWAPVSDEQLERCLQEQCLAFEEARTLEKIFEDYVPTGQGLPMRIRRADERRVVLLVNHVFTNGFGVFYWIEEWLRLYRGGDAPEEKPARSRDAGSRIAGLLSVAAYLLSFIRRSGRDAKGSTVDLSRGAAPVAGGRGYALRTYLLTCEETQQAMARSRQSGLSLTESLCSAMTDALFSAQPEKSRVCLSVPTDLGAYVSGFPAETPGNYTGSLIIQAYNGTDIQQQIQASFGWLRKRVNYWLPVFLGALSGEGKLCRSFAKQAALPIPRRAPFENFSAAISSVGVVRGAEAQRYLAAISAHTRMQTIFLCAMTLKGRMSIEVSAPCDLFDPAEVFGVVERAVAGLVGEVGATAAASTSTVT